MIHKTLTSLALGLFLASSALAVTKTACCDAAKCKTACCKVACCPPARGKAMRLAKKGVLKPKAALRTAGGCCSMPCCNGSVCCAACE